MRVNTWLKKLEEFIISYTVIAMALLLIGNIISRKLIGQSWTFAEELGSIFLIITTYFGCIYAVRRSRHIRMTALIEMLPVKGQKAITIASSLFTSACLWYFAFLSLNYMLKVFDLGRITPALGIPTWIIVIPLVLGLFMTGVQYLLLALLNLLNRNEFYIGTERKAGEVELSDLEE